MEPRACRVSPAPELAQGPPPATCPPPFPAKEAGCQEAQASVKVTAGGQRGRTPRLGFWLPPAPLNGGQDGRKSQAAQPVPQSSPVTCVPPPASRGDTRSLPRPCRRSWSCRLHLTLQHRLSASPP